MRVRATHFRWNRSVMELLNRVENQLLSCLNSKYLVGYVGLKNTENTIWTIRMNEEQKSTPLVMIHGLGGGIGLWVLNFDLLSKNRPLYAMDVLGFGKSSRPQFSINPNVAELEWVDSIEDWRKKMGLNNFFLLGHSLGGYLAACYALRYSKQVNHLILVEPWGMVGRPPEYDNRPRPLWVRAITALIRQSDPLAGLRIAGPWGPSLIKRLRPDLGRRFSTPRAAAEVVYDYIHQCNVRLPPSGESAFRTLSDAGWPRRPIVDRIVKLPPEIPITFIYGARSWLDSRPGYLVAKARELSKVDCHILQNAGHHVYADQSSKFNALINKILSQEDPTNIDEN